MSVEPPSALKPRFAMADNGLRAPMAVQLICPNLKCRRMLSVPDEVRGKLVRCQHCQQQFRVPETRKADTMVKIGGR